MWIIKHKEDYNYVYDYYDGGVYWKSHKSRALCLDSKDDALKLCKHLGISEYTVVCNYFEDDGE